MSDVISDGFGAVWAKCQRLDCDLHVVRPGTVQCDGACDDGITSPFGPEDFHCLDHKEACRG